MMRFLDYTLHKSRRCHHQMTLIFPTTKFHFQTRLLTLRLSHLMRTWRICVFTAFATPMITQCWISEIFFDSQMRCGTVFHPLCKEMALKETRLRNIGFLLKFLPRRFAGAKTLEKSSYFWGVEIQTISALNEGKIGEIVYCVSVWLLIMLCMMSIRT